jgi:uncharacterized protein (TIGR02594 family)
MSILHQYLGGQQAAAQKNAMAGMLPPQMGGARQSGEVPELMAIASSTLGLNERDQGAAIQEYLKNGGVNLDPATTAWCAAFVNATLKQGGMEGTGSNMARSFLEWGQGVDDPRKGDLAVFTRGDPNGPFGHVGFFDGYNEDGTIRVLGGNQGDSVSIANYSPDTLLGFRRANPMTQMAGM